MGRNSYLLGQIEEIAKRENKTVKELIVYYRSERYSLRKIAKVYGCSYQAILLLANELGIEFTRASAKEYAFERIKELGYRNFKDYFASRPDKVYLPLAAELGVSLTTVKKLYEDTVLEMVHEQRIGN